MADSAQEKTEQATPKRREESAKKGQVAYSRELTGALLFLVGLGSMKMGGAEVFGFLTLALRESFTLKHTTFNEAAPAGYLADIGSSFLIILIPIFSFAFASVVLVGMAQTKFGMATGKLKPNFSKLNPLKGLKRIFSQESLVNTATSLLKMSLVSLVVYVTVVNAMPRLLQLAGAPLLHIVFTILDLLFLLGFRVGGGLLLIGIFDVFYRIWKTNKDIMMSKEDVKEERKKSDGDPQIKARIKQIQREKAMQRMQQDIETADVVVRNPTHFAVALKYDSDISSAPKVVAKGRSKMALHIIEIAKNAGVEVIENRPLARELYRSVRVGAFIPERLFKAVAEVLAYVFQKKNNRHASMASS